MQGTTKSTSKGFPFICIFMVIDCCFIETHIFLQPNKARIRLVVPLNLLEMSLHSWFEECSGCEEKAVVPHPSTLAWKIPWKGAWWVAVHGVAKSRTRLSHFTFTFHFHALEKAMAPHSSTLAWKIPWMEEPGGLKSMGSLRVGHDWSDLATVAVDVKVSSNVDPEWDVWWETSVLWNRLFLIISKTGHRMYLEFCFKT